MKIEKVSYDEGQFAVAVEGQTLHADELLVAAGRRPNLGDLGLDTVGLDPHPRSMETDEGMRASDADDDGPWAIATSPARARSRTCRCTRPRSRCATSR